MIFITYLGKMVLCSGILFGYYWLFLRNRRFHHYNRFYLLGTLALSIVLPLFKIPVFNEDTGALNQVVYQTARVVTLQPQQIAVPAQPTTSLFTVANFIWVLYIAGILILLAILGRSLWYIRKISRQYPFELVEKLKFYQTHEPGTPFSFFRSIFWNDQLNFNSTQGQQIFRHELFHVQQKHSADILLAELITIACWFNPFFHLIKKELKAIHEFLADQYAASDSNRYQYAELLVQQVMIDHRLSITHYFFQNQLKRRIAMITQLNQSRYGYWSRVMVLPVSLILFFSVALYAGENKKTDIVSYKSLNAEEIFFISFRVLKNGSPTDLTFYKEKPDTQGQQLNELIIKSGAPPTTINMLSDEKKKYYMDEIARVFSNIQSSTDLKTERTHFVKFVFRPDGTMKSKELQLEANMGDVFQATDTIPAALKQAEKLRELKVIREKQLMLEKILQEKKEITDDKASDVLKKTLLDLKMQEEALQKGNAQESPFRYDEKNTREMQLKIAYNEQLILEKMLQEKAVREDQEVSNSIKKKLQEVKTQQQALQEINTNTNKNTNNDQHFNYDEKQILEKQQNDIQVLKKELALREDSQKELQILDTKLKTLNDVQHFDYVQEDSIPITLIRFFNKNFRYPVEMLDNGGEGSIWYSALLDETGKLRDYEIYNEEPAAAKGRVQEIVIIGYSKQSGLILSAEKTQQLIKNEVLRLSGKGGNLFGVRKVIPARYYYKATFRLEKGNAASPKKERPPVSNVERTFVKMEINPQFPGGPKAFEQYLQSNMQYPLAAKNKNIEGTVQIRFIVQQEGGIKNVEVLNGPAELREEAARLIQNSGKWVPGVQNGYKVNAYVEQPITFALRR